MREHLRQKGWCVVPGVIPPAKCDSIIDRLWECFEGTAPGLSRDDPGTWVTHWPASQHGIFTAYECGHWQPVWDVRLLCNRVFRELWATDELVSSFDGIGVIRPPETVGSFRKEAGPVQNLSWLHWDQSPTLKDKFASVQGLCNLVTVSSQDSSLLVVPGSHHMHGELCARWGIGGEKADWIKLTADQKADVCREVAAGRLEEPIVVSAPAGSVILWYSTTLHMNVPPKEGRPAVVTHPGRDLWRWVVYVCQAPLAGMSTKDVERKRKAYREFRMTNHWPNRRFKLVGKAPRTYSAKEREDDARRTRLHRDRTDKPTLLQEQLACLKPY